MSCPPVPWMDWASFAINTWTVARPVTRAGIPTNRPGSRTGAATIIIPTDPRKIIYSRRERFVGEWIPEPLPAATQWTGGSAIDPADHVTLDESVNVALRRASGLGSESSAICVKVSAIRSITRPTIVSRTAAAFAS